MKCPSCKTGALLPTEVEQGLVGAGSAKSARIVNNKNGMSTSVA